MTEQIHADLVEELIRLMPVIWRRAKPDPSTLGEACPGQLSYSDCRVLIHLALHDRDSAGAMADQIGLSRPAATEAVDRLVARGLVVRETCESDRRRVSLALTPAAVEIAARFVDRWRTGFDRALDQLTEDEQVAFHKGMFALADSLSESEHEHQGIGGAGISAGSPR